MTEGQRPQSGDDAATQPPLWLLGPMASPCQECGACCGHSSDWPRFSLESDDDIARLPERLVNDGQNGMRCEGNRCLALVGEIGTWTSCSVYPVRPLVCRDCVPGDDACSMARERVGLPLLAMG